MTLSECSSRRMEWLKRFWFWLRSFFKREWEFADYPLRSSVMKTSVPHDASHSVQIIGWWFIRGSGPTREMALEVCEENFYRTRQICPTLPRPGTEVDPMLEKWNPYWHMARVSQDMLDEFTEHVFGTKNPVTQLLLNEVMMDNTTLTDCAEFPHSEEFPQRIRDYYGVDITRLPDDRILTIFKAILAKRWT